MALYVEVRCGNSVHEKLGPFYTPEEAREAKRKMNMRMWMYPHDCYTLLTFGGTMITGDGDNLRGGDEG